LNQKLAVAQGGVFGIGSQRHFEVFG